MAIRSHCSHSTIDEEEDEEEEGVEGDDVEVEEDVEANDAPPAADANVATAVCHLATTAGALFGTEATREVFSRRQTAGRAAA